MCVDVTYHITVAGTNIVRWCYCEARTSL